MSKTLFLITLLFYSSSSFAISSGNDFVSSEAMPINSFMLIAATLMGLVSFGFGLYGVSKSQTMPQQYPMASNVTKMVSGVLLLSLTGFYNVLMATTGLGTSGNYSLNVASSSLLNEGASGLANSALGEILPEQTIQILLSFIYLVGLYSFVKGVFMLKDLGQSPQQQQGQSVTKSSLVHMIGGLISMNITQFSCIVGATLGMAELCVT